MDVAEHHRPRAGTLIEGRYRVIRCIGEGGMGCVQEVLDLRTDARRALKLLRPGLGRDSSFAEQLLAEARIVARIRSDHLVPVSDAGVDALTGAPFFVMELLVGESLGALLRRRGGLPAAEVVPILSQVGMAVDRAHAADVAHLDLKPENLFATARDDGSPCIKVLDFGIARTLGGDSAERPIAGTPLYMAPEQLAGDATIGTATDLYSLGHVAFALLSGEAYFTEERAALSGDPAAFRGRIALGVGELPSARAARRSGRALPAAFDVWFTRATARRPADRFASAGAAVRALAATLGVALPRPSMVLHPGQLGEPEPATERAETTETALATDASAPRRPARRRTWVVAACAALGAIGLGGAALVSQGPGEPRAVEASARPLQGTSVPVPESSAPGAADRPGPRGGEPASSPAPGSRARDAEQVANPAIVNGTLRNGISAPATQVPAPKATTGTVLRPERRSPNKMPVDSRAVVGAPSLEEPPQPTPPVVEGIY